MHANRDYLLSIASGCVWAGIAWWLGHDAFGRAIWGGVIASPLIGLLMGWTSKRFRDRSTLARAGWSLVGLYVAATMFGLAVGVFDLLTGENRIAIEVILQAVIAVLWGMTFLGYVLFLWPLAYLNQAMLRPTLSGVTPPASFVGGTLQKSPGKYLIRTYRRTPVDTPTGCGHITL